MKWPKLLLYNPRFSTLYKEERHFVSQGKAANGNTTDAKDVGADDPKYAQCN